MWSFFRHLVFLLQKGTKTIAAIKTNRIQNRVEGVKERIIKIRNRQIVPAPSPLTKILKR
jgi:hypothetical protein